MLYHKDIGFPKGTRQAIKKIGLQSLEYGYHAKQASKTDKYGTMYLPVMLDFSKAELIEVEIKNNKVVKMVLRSKYDDKLDIIHVVTNELFTKTVWFNRTGDLHKTLDHTKYRKP